MNIWIILLHVIAGFAFKSFPMGITGFYSLAFMYFVFDILKSRDGENRAGFYALYLVGFEICYRVGGYHVSYELGKYLSSLILLIGLLFRRQSNSVVFLFLLFLLVPAMFLTESLESGRARKMILFNFSGPLSLLMSGAYFYSRKIKVEHFNKWVKVALLPSITLLVGLSIKSSLSSMSFESVQSSASASGGFGPNQVSTALGFLFMLLLMMKIQKLKFTKYAILDWLILAFLLIRGLLTLSRGGILASGLALSAALGVYYVGNPGFRRFVISRMRYIFLGFIGFLAVIYFANAVSDNFLYYRYMGFSTKEALTGERDGERSYLTGRDKIMEDEISAFMVYPILGHGFGMSAEYRLKQFDYHLVAHTEFTRLLSEHGILGGFFMLIAFLIIPVRRFIYCPNTLTKFYFVGFFVISMMTMFHGAMRLALPGILYGFSLMTIITPKKKNKAPLNK